MIALQCKGLGLMAAFVVISASVSACGSSSSGPSGSTSAIPGSGSKRAEISQAADVSESAKGYVFRISILETYDGAPVARISGDGTYSAVNRSVAMTLTTHVQGKSSQVQEIVIGRRIWIKEPAAVAAKIPGGNPWLEIDLSKVGKQSYLGDLGSLMSMLSSSSRANPAETLVYLKAESSQVQDLGSATVNGVPTTHFRFMVNLAKAGAGRSPAVRDAAQVLLKKLPGKILDETDVPFDVWIDGAHYVRELSYTVKAIPRGISQALSVTSVVQMTRYGPQASPTPPPADETGNLLAILRAEGKSTSL